MKCFLDLDGVLVDFVGGICRAHGRENPYLLRENLGHWHVGEIWGMPDEAFYAPMDADFWAGLRMLPDGAEILQLLEECFEPHNICLLTSPTRTRGAVEGKVQWVADHLPQYRGQLLVGTAKRFCAHAGAILIDDRPENVMEFHEQGGQSILVPRPWNHLHDVYSPLIYVAHRLGNCAAGKFSSLK